MIKVFQMGKTRDQLSSAIVCWANSTELSTNGLSYILRQNWIHIDNPHPVVVSYRPTVHFGFIGVTDGFYLLKVAFYE